MELENKELKPNIKVISFYHDLIVVWTCHICIFSPPSVMMRLFTKGSRI